MISTLLLFALASSTIDVGGIPRAYEIYTPPTLDRSHKSPVVFVLHGAGGSGKQMAQAGKFHELAGQKGFIVVYPDGYEHHWNDGRGIPEWTADAKNIDDVAFFSALIDKMIKAQNVDPNRVYVTGISNGGLMTHRLACELGNRIAAIAPVVRTFTVAMAASCRPARPMPVMMFFGTADKLVPFEGGGQKMGSVVTPVLSVRQTIEKWAALNGCPEKPPAANTVHLECKADSEVVAYILEGAGHSWPPDAAPKIWSFFEKHKLR